jgi:hypothetical protein
LGYIEQAQLPRVPMAGSLRFLKLFAPLSSVPKEPIAHFGVLKKQHRDQGNQANRASSNEAIQ